jgi:adenylate cyclase
MSRTEPIVFDKINQSIEQNLTDEQFSVDSLCKEVGISRSRLHRILIEETGLSTTLYIRKERLEKAKNLLSTTDLRISEIADAVGIGSPQNFSKYFTDEFDISPTDFRKHQPLATTPVIAKSEPVAVSPRDLSIAVLPFVNMSNDRGQEYFSDGITEEIINVLAQVPALKVAGRTSSFSFKNKNTDLRQIGAKLSVNHILEGSVRKSGNKLRITAQLIKVEDGFHLWSEKYDRELDDVFEIQDEISLAILEEVKIKLFGTEKKALLKRDTHNTEAYQLYLKGLFYFNKLSGGEALFKAVSYFEEAIALEPDYAAAYTGMAGCYIHLWFFAQVPPKQSIEIAKWAIQKALTLDPHNAENHVRDAHMKMWYDWDMKAAQTIFKKALAMNPNSIEGNLYYGFWGGFNGDFALAHTHFAKALALDPLAGMNQFAGAFCYWWEGDLDECLVQIEKTIQFKPYLWIGYYVKSLALLERFKFDELLPTIAKARQLYPSCLTICFEGIAFVFSGQLAKAQEVIAELEANPHKYPISHHDIGQFYIALGNLDKGHYHWNLALEQHDGRMLFINTFFRKAKFFKSHPQFARFFREIEEVSIRAAIMH